MQCHAQQVLIGIHWFIHHEPHLVDAGIEHDN